MIINPMFLGHMQDKVKESLAAATVGRPVLMIQFALMYGVATGVAALVARFIGAQDYENADEATRQSMILSIILGIITAFPVIIFAEPIARLVGARPESVKLAADYSAIISYSSVPAFLTMTITMALRSAGEVKGPLYVGAATIVTNIVFDALLIRGAGPIPALGLNGAAIATGISRVVGIVLLFYCLDRSILRGSLRRWKIKPNWYGRIMNIGIPAAIQNLLYSVNYSIYVRILGLLPNAMAAQAALGPSFALEGIAYMPGGAYAAAATALVGQNLGAGNPKRAERAALVATYQAAALMSVMGIIFLVAPHPLARAFIGKDQAASSAAIVPLIVSYLRINALSEPLFAVGMTLRGALQGAGDVSIPTVLTFISLVGFRLPVTYLLAIKLGYGVTGAWIAMSASTALSGILAAVWFKMGRWKTQKV